MSTTVDAPHWLEEPEPGAPRQHPISLADPLLSAALTLYRAERHLAGLRTEDRALARLACEALLQGRVDVVSLAHHLRHHGRDGLVHWLHEPS